MITSFVVINIFRFYIYNRKINKLKEEFKIKLTEIQKEFFFSTDIERRIEEIKNEYEIKITKLERKRDYILNKAPVKRIIKKDRK